MMAIWFFLRRRGIRPHTWERNARRFTSSSFVILALFCLPFTSAPIALAQPSDRNEEPSPRLARPGEPCKVDPLPHWSQPERWAWERICVGAMADFDESLGQVLRRPENAVEDCQRLDSRILSSEFLEIILLHEPFRTAIPRKGIRIYGAYFSSEIDLSDGKIQSPLWLDGSCFVSEVNMRRITTPAHISFDGSHFDKTLDMDSASVGGDLYMRSKAKFSEVDLRGVEIGDQMSIRDSTFTGNLNLSSISVGASLFLVNSEFQDVDILTGSIGGQLGANGSTFKGSLTIDSTSVGTTLFMREVELEAPADLVYLTIGSNLDVAGATSVSLDLTGTVINGELRLGASNGDVVWAPYKDWQGGSHDPFLNLRNTTVGTLQDTERTWPENLKLELGGFTYRGLGGLQMVESEGSPYRRESSWFVEWLAKDESYSAQPYLHLAGVLSNVGYPDKAGDVLYASRERERQGFTPSQWEWWWLTLLKYIIGYGYGLRFFLALGWVLVFALVGWIILWVFGERTHHKQVDRNQQRVRLGFWYSLDMVLPVLHLRELHYDDVDLVTGARWCFYLLKIAGFVLVFFVIAGLSGLMN